MKFTHTKSLLILISILLLLVIPASADVTHAPKSITFYGYVMSHNQIGVWFMAPADSDFNGTQLWFDNVYQGQLGKTVNFTYKEFLAPGVHTFSTHTIDTYGNVNTTWVNISVEVIEGGCSEDWFYDDWCSGILQCVAQFIMNPSSGMPPLGVVFNDTSTGGPIAWNWSFGEGNFSEEQNPLFMFSQENIYTITLTVFNGNNTDSSSQQLYVLNVTVGGGGSSSSSTGTSWIDTNTILAVGVISIPAIVIITILLLRRREEY